MPNKMKLAVLTRRYGYNYGSSLQAYAMRLMLEGLGHKVTVLNYDEFSQHPTWKIKPTLRNIVVPILCFLGKLGLNNNIIYNAKIESEQKIKFRIFDRNNICPTKTRLYSSHQLKNAINGMDACICGSDQIWNPLIFDKHFFLDFCDKGEVRKIAYAPSFGVSKILNNKDDIKKYLSDFNHISVREKQGQTIIKNLIGSIFPVVLDPTLMIRADVWKKLMQIPNVKLPKRYIACYFLGHNYIPQEIISSILKQLDCEIVNITTFRTTNDIKGIQLDNLSPLEFIYAIDKASYVLTDSFHATVFSILFHTSFYSFCKHKKSDENNENSRLISLLSLFNLESRYVDDNDMEMKLEKINFEECDKKLDILRTYSYDFINKALM